MIEKLDNLNMWSIKDKINEIIYEVNLTQDKIQRLFNMIEELNKQDGRQIELWEGLKDSLKEFNESKDRPNQKHNSKN